MNKLNREKIECFSYIVETNKLMRKGGILLVSEGIEKKPNIMTIGWGLIGTIWRKPFFVVAVRHSRYTFKLMEESSSFTVCLPAKDMGEVLEVCGSESGRDIDKFNKLKLSARKGINIETPYIEECPIHYECIVRYKNDLKFGQIDKGIEAEVYPNKNMHMLYYGEIVDTYEVNEASKLLF